MRSMVFLLLLGTVGCATGSSSRAPVKTSSKKAKKRSKKKKKKKEEPAERFVIQCVSEDLPGCEEIVTRRLLDQRVEREVSEHLALYRPLVRRLKRLIEEPSRSPDARVEGDVELAEGERNHQGPHELTLDVQVRYDRGLKRHPKAKSIRKVFRQIGELNKLLTVASDYHELTVETLEELMVELKLKGKGSKNKVEVQIPEEDSEIVLEASPVAGTIVSAVVTTEPGLQYRVIHEWIRPLKPSLTISESTDGILISEVPEATVEMQFSKVIEGEELCDRLRGEIRILFGGAPRRRWAVDEINKGEEAP